MCMAYDMQSEWNNRIHSDYVKFPHNRFFEYGLHHSCSRLESRSSRRRRRPDRRVHRNSEPFLVHWLPDLCRMPLGTRPSHKPSSHNPCRFHMRPNLGTAYNYHHSRHPIRTRSGSHPHSWGSDRHRRCIPRSDSRPPPDRRRHHRMEHSPHRNRHPSLRRFAPDPRRMRQPRRRQ